LQFVIAIFFINTDTVTKANKKRKKIANRYFVKAAQLKRMDLVNLWALTWYILFLLVRNIVERKL